MVDQKIGGLGFNDAQALVVLDSVRYFLLDVKGGVIIKFDICVSVR